jgi:putative DNA primase/helicase
MNDALTIDYQMAERFLTTLASNDTYHTFQVIKEPKDSKTRGGNSVLHGTLVDLAKQLERLNKSGNGIFVCVNQTDGRERKTENIISVRSLFADFDKVGAGLPALARCGLKPQIIVESSGGKIHGYWLVSDCHLNEFKPLQEAIAEKLSSDKSVKDLPRVMRVAGYLHQKDPNKPFQTKIIEINEIPAYTVEEIKAGLGLDLSPTAKKPSISPQNSKFIDTSKPITNNKLAKVRSALIKIPSELAEDRKSWMEVAMALHSESDTLFDCFLEWSEGAKNHDADACNKLWDSLSHKTSGGITIGTLFHLAKVHGGWEDTSYLIDSFELAEPLSDIGNARRLVRNNSGIIRYCREPKAWLFWNSSSGRWEFSNELIMRLAEDTTFKMVEEASGNPELYAATIKHALKSQSLRSLESQVKLARSVQGVAIGVNQLDSDPYLLCVKNGTVDLKTGILRDSNHKDLITKQANVVYDNKALCPLWLNFLDKIFSGNSELIAFMQRAIGYSLTGTVSEQVLFLAHGFGANGKSVLLNVITGLLGDHAKNAQSDSLMAKANGGGASNDIARLHGARFVSTSETEDGKRFAEAQVKLLTGGDVVTARFLFREFFEFTPTFKIWMAANHKPVINGSDYGIWRRIILIPFNVTIPENERDGNLLMKIANEYSGILNWAIQGCINWQKFGLSTPDVIKNATNAYKVEMDSIGQWLEECCELKNTFQTAASRLYISYKDWAEQNGLHPLSAKTLAQRLTERGFEKHKSNGIFYRGLKVI